MWMSQVFKSNNKAHASHHFYYLCSDLCQPIVCKALTRWTAPVTTQPMKHLWREQFRAAIWSHLKDQNRDLNQAIMCEPLRYTDSSNGFCSMCRAEARLAIVHSCFPVQLTCRVGRSPRIWLPTLCEYSHRHTETTSDYDLAPIIVGFESVMEKHAQIHGFVNCVN